MKRAIVTPAALAPTALADLKDWLGVSISADDNELTALLRAALEMCEDFTGLMPLQQLCEERQLITGDWVWLATRPVQAIASVTGLVADGTSFVLDPSAYSVDFDADGGARIRVTRPGAAGRVAVRFTAGLVADWASLPDPLRHGVVRLAAHQYREREGEDAKAQVPPAAVAALWRPWRRLRLA